MRHGLTTGQTKEIYRLLHGIINYNQVSTCVRCGKYCRLNAHHIYRKGMYPRMKFMIENVIGLCRGCRSYLHANPLEEKAFVKGILTDEIQAFLLQTSKEAGKIRFDYNELKEQLI